MHLATLLLAAAPVATPLNHFFVVPDAATFEAMKRSAFLHEAFGVYEERTTVRNDTSYTGIYFYGANTYFEFLPPDASRHAGDAGVAFGLEAPGASAALEKRLAQALGKPVRNFVVTRRLGSDDVPWFRMVGVEPAAEAAFSTWSMEYDPAFLSRWHAELPPASRTITRANVLTRYAESLNQAKGRDARWLRDVSALTLALSEADLSAFARQLEAYGYRVETNGVETVARGAHMTFTLRPASPEARGIVEASFVVKEGRLSPAEHHFGSSVLSFPGDGTARWRFSATP